MLECRRLPGRGAALLRDPAGAAGAGDDSSHPTDLSVGQRLSASGARARKRPDKFEEGVGEPAAGASPGGDHQKRWWRPARACPSWPEAHRAKPFHLLRIFLLVKKIANRHRRGGRDLDLWARRSPPSTGLPPCSWPPRCLAGWPCPLVGLAGGGLAPVALDHGPGACGAKGSGIVQVLLICGVSRCRMGPGGGRGEVAGQWLGHRQRHPGGA